MSQAPAIGSVSVLTSATHVAGHGVAIRSNATKRASWVRNPAWDGVWMLNALWLVPLALVMTRGSDPEGSPLDILYFGLTALFWIGHRLSSTWLAYCTEAYRPLLRTQPVRFVVLPALVTIACFAIFLPSDAALPWTRSERLVGLAILDYLFVTYHFGAQHFGALSLYRARSGSGSRRLDWLFALGVGGVLVFLSDILAGNAAYQDLWANGSGLPAWLASAQGGVRAGALALLVGATGAFLAVELRAKAPSFPRILYVVGLSAMVAIGLSPRALFPFLVIWTSQHWMLATGLASRAASAEPAPDRGVVRKLLHGLNARPWVLVLLLMALSTLLLPVFEVEANRQGGTYYGDRIFGVLAESLRTSTWVPALVALGFATGFVHYLLDRAVYRMSDPQVRAAARGLIAR